MIKVKLAKYQSDNCSPRQMTTENHTTSEAEEIREHRYILFEIMSAVSIVAFLLKYKCRMLLMSTH